MPSYIQRQLLRCKMLVGGVAQTPLICIFQCRLRVPAGRFLPGDAFRVIENLHEVRSSFCQRSILHLFRDRRIQKRNAPFLHTFRKFFLRQQCSLPAHFRGNVRVQNVGSCGTSERMLCNCSYACCSAGVTFLHWYSRWMVRCQYNASFPCFARSVAS